MKHTDSSLHRTLSPGWQLLGELELTVNQDTDHTVGKWLTVILNALDLQADFMSKVLKSAQEVTTRVMQAGAVTKSQHFHLLVFSPPEAAAKGHSWGFFRIEKIDSEADKANPDHTVEFYLYLEGR